MGIDRGGDGEEKTTRDAQGVGWFLSCILKIACRLVALVYFSIVLLI